MTMTIQARTLIREALPWAAFILAIALLAVLTGCASPGEMQVDPTSGKASVTRIDYVIPLTGIVLFSVDVDTSQADRSVLGLLAKGLGVLIAARLGQSAMTRSGRANWSVIGDADASWKGTSAALLHNLIGTSSPAEAVAKLPAPKGV